MLYRQGNIQAMNSIFVTLCLSLLALISCPFMAFADTAPAPHTGKMLSVMSLNLAHGRKDSLNQVLVSKSRTQNNLSDIAEVIKRTQIDVVALQEADGPSRWSGKFNHVAHLANMTSLPAHLHSQHAQNWVYSYGTALISKTAFTDEVHHTFKPTPPTTNKGFTLGQLAWQRSPLKDDILLVDVVSVHLDFSRQAIREQQITEMTMVLEKRKGPYIIMGDFNSDWLTEEKVVRELANQAQLHAYHPSVNNMGTYPSSRKRLDWILISNELEFVDYRTLPDVLSDHLAVIARIRIK